MPDNDAIMFEKVAILGLGLLGGSVARAGRKKGLIRNVAGYGRKPERLQYALDHGIADSTHTVPEEAVRDADLVMICTPVGLVPAMIDTIAPHLKPGCIVTDVGSTKTKIVEHAERILPDNINFIGGHPMAGAETSGIESATDTLFENAICVLTSSSKTNIGALNKLEHFWKALKTKVMVATPGEHDMLVAASSHLAHMVAVSLTRCMAGVSGKNEKVIPLLAGGFRDTTRIASGSPEMWRDICLENREFISTVMRSYLESVTQASNVVESGGPDELIRYFSEAKEFRDELPAKGIGILEPVNEILVDVADRPGVIGEIAMALGESSINLRNINVQHVRELQGGTLSLILEKASDIGRATDLLNERGFSARAVL